MSSAFFDCVSTGFHIFWGTRGYLPPEVMTFDPDKIYIPSNDVWAMGCVLFSLLYLKPDMVWKTVKHLASCFWLHYSGLFSVWKWIKIQSIWEIAWPFVPGLDVYRCRWCRWCKLQGHVSLFTVLRRFWCYKVVFVHDYWIYATVNVDSATLQKVVV